MIVLLSPAKTLDFSPVETPTTHPRLLKKSLELVKVLKRKSIPELQELMSISENLSELNRDRFREFSTPFTPINAKPAVLAFKGDVYQDLAAHTFDEDDLDFAQDHLRILSGLYGLLRPRDLMQAYRLEMGTRLETRRGKNLYEFWGRQITSLLNEDIEETHADLVLNLASQEYFKSVQPKSLKVPVLNIHFQEVRDGGVPKVIAFNAKKARGRMAHYIVKHRITQPEDLKELDINDYQFNERLSSRTDWYFIK